ncbi:MAG: hypothetical protein HQ588_05705 [Deltaproteobacteria bacterium]|nr:hypothetical protein [Deltaproteobacteria bacterium]
MKRKNFSILFATVLVLSLSLIPVVPAMANGGGNGEVIEVLIDIKPGSEDNCINLESKGVVPVAVLTTDGFDASDVNPGTVVFAEYVSWVRWVMCDVDGDGDLDMLFHFKTQLLDLDESSTEATLTGETTDGQLIEGTDVVKMVP